MVSETNRRDQKDMLAELSAFKWLTAREKFDLVNLPFQTNGVDTRCDICLIVGRL